MLILLSSLPFRIDETSAKAVNRTSSHTALSCSTVRSALLLDCTILSHPPPKCGAEGEKNATPIAVLPFPRLLSYGPGCSHTQLPSGISKPFVSSFPFQLSFHAHRLLSFAKNNCWCPSDGNKTAEGHDERIGV